METNRPWNWRLTVLKTIKMLLIRPSMTNFKMIVRADCAVSACSPLPPSIKALAHWLSVGGVGVWTEVCPSPPVVGIQNKGNFPPTWPLHWLLSGEQQNPTFGYRKMSLLQGFWPASQEAQGCGTNEFQVAYRCRVFCEVKVEFIWLFQLNSSLVIFFPIWISVAESWEQRSSEIGVNRFGVWGLVGVLW